VEPEWHNFDEINGATVSNYALETKIEADAELIKNRLFYAFNILYEPEGTITGTNPTGWDPESTFGVSSALAFQVIPNVVIGAGLRTDPDAARKENETQSWFGHTHNARGRLRSAADGTTRI
jgi:hypothetical protein